MAQIWVALLTLGFVHQLAPSHYHPLSIIFLFPIHWLLYPRLLGVFNSFGVYTLFQLHFLGCSSHHVWTCFFFMANPTASKIKGTDAFILNTLSHLAKLIV